ncbi:MAG: hypothetical protein AAFY88_10340 [Acidobacteriota bacterium]
MASPNEDLAWLGAVGRALAPLSRVAVHDVRSPLNALRLNLTLVRRTLDQGGAERWLSVVEEEVGRLEACFNASLSLFTPGVGAEPDADLSSSFRTSEALLASAAEKRGVHWRSSVPALPGPWPAGVAAAWLATTSLLVGHSERGDALTVAAERTAAGATLVVEGQGQGGTDRGVPLRSDIERLWRRRGPIGALAWPAVPADGDGIRLTITVEAGDATRSSDERSA